MTDYLGYAICFLFEEDGKEWSVLTNESGVLVTQEPNLQHFQYSDWTKFEQVFPKMAELIQVEMMARMQETFAVLKGVC